MSKFSREYQRKVTGKLGMAWVQNGVKFDGMIDGILIEVKGRYSQFINKKTGKFYGWFKKGEQSFVNQAVRQLDASEGAKIQWYFAEKETMELVKEVLMNARINGIERIEFIFQPFK